MKRHIRLNSSAVRHSACIRKTNLVLQGYHEIATPNDIVFGNCFHDFVNAYRRNGQEFNAALEAGWNFRKTVPRIFTKYRKEYLDDKAYFKNVCFMWSMEHSSWKTVEIDGVPCSELSWSIPFFEGDFIDVSLCGTIDDLCMHRDNPDVIAIRDYKTTSVTDTGAYLDRYRMSGQLMFYYHGMTLMAQEALRQKPDSRLANLWTKAVSRCAFIEGIFLNSDPFKVKFAVSDAFEFSDERVAEYRDMLTTLCRKLDRPADWNFQREGLLTKACESEGYGRQCSFFEVCAAKSQDDSDMLLRSMFAKDDDYNPLLP